MAPSYSTPPIDPFYGSPAVPRPEQTLYTISEEDQQRLAPYLPQKRDTFLIEGPVVLGCFILSRLGASTEDLKAFTERLKTETNPKTLWADETGQLIASWYQYLTPEQVQDYKSDPAVSSISISDSETAESTNIDTPSSSSSTSARQSLPHVTLTYAQSLDSQVSLRPGQRTTLSGLETKAMTQFLRTHHDAILVGAGTANADDPGLNTSFSYDGESIVGLAEQPRPLILDPGRSWREDKCEKMFRLARARVGRAPWWIVCEDAVNDEGFVLEADAIRDEERIEKIKKVGGDVIKAGNYTNRDEGVEWEKILKAMWRTGIRSVMIEGGATVINDLLRAKNQHFVTSVVVTIAPTYLGSGGAVVAPPRSVSDENEARLSGVTWIPFGQDVVMAGRLIPKA
ncbi:hypothetical protein N431DRAFT_438112 [Stipitochalara longipes BDJ]|nr:hypothetical protein N431DRAFT_438112 [Stipitochalara longipes BDJ]